MAEYVDKAELSLHLEEKISYMTLGDDWKVKVLENEYPWGRGVIQMTEYVNKVGLLTHLKKKKSFGELTAKEAIRTVEAEQTIDIVHCSECEFSTTRFIDCDGITELVRCNGRNVGLDFFCADGKKERINDRLRSNRTDNSKNGR